MITVRYADDRGATKVGWLDSRHSFSFGDYYDPKHMGFGPLRVINEDRVRPGAGFPTHGHRDMEIVSYVLDGALEHKDSMGTGSVLHYGDVQRMSAGTGVRHSEFNPSKDSPVHFLQIWLLPDREGLPPSYEQKAFAETEKRNRLRLVAAPDGRDGAVTIHQDARVYASVLDGGADLRHPLAPGRRAWIQVARGGVDANGEDLRAGDGAAIEKESAVVLKALTDDAEALLFDLP